MSTFVKHSNLLKYVHKMSTQYLLENFSSYQYSVLTRVLILSTHFMPGLTAVAMTLCQSNIHWPIKLLMTRRPLHITPCDQPAFIGVWS